MIIYIANILVMLFWATVLSPKRSVDRRRVFCIACTLQLMLLAGLRGDYASKDTFAYHNHFNSVQLQTLVNMFNEVVRYLGGGGSHYTDAGFYFLMKIAQSLGVSWQVFAFIVAALTTGLFGRFVYRLSPNPLVSYVLYASVFFPFISMVAMRQGVAISLVAFVGYELAKDRKLLPFVIVVFFAFLMHRSALLGLVIYLIPNYHFNWKTAIAFLVTFAVVVIAGRPILMLVNGLMGFGAQYNRIYVGSNNLVYVIGLGLIWMGCAIRAYAIADDQRKDFDFFILAMMVGLLYSSFSFYNSNANRVAYYFLVSVVVVVPIVMQTFKKHTELIIGSIVVFISVMFILFVQPHIIGTANYIPFWIS